MGQFFDELKRRNVFRVGVAYLVSAWLVLQVADVVLNNISAPDWVFSVFMLAGAVFFVPVLVFSWAYELTPEGLKREHEVDRTRSITRRTGQKLDKITIAMLVAVVAFVLVERNLPDTDDAVPVEAAGEADTEVVATTVDDRSIAVLAFDDLSPEGDQAFFAEGLSEEILNVLAQTRGLKVAGRTSSFAFKGKDTDLREIGEILNVAHILEGSVRKAGNRIRVTAQLIQASDGFHLFSKTYDRDLDDVFEVQDDLAALIGEALRSELAGPAVPASTPTNIETYDLYLLARQRIRSRNPDLMQEALEMLDEALAKDANYAPAIAQRALVGYLLSDSPGAYGTRPEVEARRESHALVDRALEIDPQLADAHAVRGLLLSDGNGGNPDVIAALRRALAINPSHENAKNWLASELVDLDEVVATYEDVVYRDPMFRPAFNNLIQAYLNAGDFDNAEALIERVQRVSGLDDSVRQAWGTVAFMKGELAESIRNLDYAFETNPNATIVRLWLGYALLQIGDFERAAKDAAFSLQLLAHGEMGDFESADRMIRETDFRSGDTQRKIRHVADYLAARGRSAEVVEIVERVYGGVPELLEAIPVGLSYGTEYLGPLAYAYLQDGRDDEFRLILDTMSATLREQEANGSDNWYQWLCRAQYAALSGDADGAISNMQRAADKGFVAASVTEPLFNLLADDGRYTAIVEHLRARAREERGKLGLDIGGTLRLE